MSSDMSIVGSYTSADAAAQARGHLTAAGVEPVEIIEADEDVWEVTAPTARHDEALEELQRMEQQLIRRFF